MFPAAPKYEKIRSPCFLIYSFRAAKEQRRPRDVPYSEHNTRLWNAQEVRLGRIPGLPLVPLLRKLLMVPGVMRGAPPRAKQDKAKQKEQSRQAKAETAGSRVVDSAHNHQSSSGSARVSDAATAAAPAEVAPSPASGAENAASPLQVPPAQPRAGVKGGSACSAASSTSSSNSGRASSGRAASAAPAAPAPAPAAPAASREAKAAAAAAAAPEPEQKPRPATADAATSAVPEASSVSRASTRSARSVRSAGVGSAAVGSAPRPAASTQYSARHQQPQPSPAGSTGSSCGESSGSGGYVTIRPRSELADQEEGLLEDEEEEMEESEAGDLQPIPPTATRLQRLQTTAHTPASALFHRALHADEAESEAATGTRLQRLKATATTPAPILFPRPPPSESTSASATPESSLGLSSNFSDAPSKTLSVAIMETLETLDQKIMQMERRFEAWEDRFEQDGLLIAQQRNANMELASRVVRRPMRMRPAGPAVITKRAPAVRHRAPSRERVRRPFPRRRGSRRATASTFSRGAYRLRLPHHLSLNTRCSEAGELLPWLGRLTFVVCWTNSKQGVADGGAGPREPDRGAARPDRGPYSEPAAPAAAERQRAAGEARAPGSLCGAPVC